MSAQEDSISYLVALGFSDSLAREALCASHGHVEQATSYCLNSVTQAIELQSKRTKCAAKQVSTQRDMLKADSISRNTLRLTARQESSVYTSQLPIEFENTSAHPLCVHVVHVCIHRVGVDADNSYHEVPFHIYTPSGVLVPSTYRIELDAAEKREYFIALDDKCDSDVIYKVTVQDTSGQKTALEALKQNTGTSHPSSAAPKAVDTTAAASLHEAVRALRIGEAYYVSRATEDACNGKGLELYYERKSKGDWQMEFRHRMPKTGQGKQSLDMNAPVSAKTYGTTCPSCGGQMEELRRYTSSDGFMGICRDLWACSDEKCCIVRVCDFEGYGYV